MAHKTLFERKLNKLFQERTFNLRAKLGIKKLGRKPTINRKKLVRAIGELQDLSTVILAKGLAKTEFEDNAGTPKRRKVKGRGWTKQRDYFDEWFNKTFPTQDELVYVFWKKRECLYVGRTGTGGSRPSSHFEKKWCQPTRIDIYPSRSKSHTPKLECLAVHHFEPRVNKYKPSKKKWTKKCPLCALHKHIETDLKKIFRIR